MQVKSLGLAAVILMLTACGTTTQPAGTDTTPTQSAPDATPDAGKGKGKTIILGKPGANAERLPNGALMEAASMNAQLMMLPDAEITDSSIQVPLYSSDPTSQQLLSAQPGDNLVSAPTADAPYGFVREVTDKTVVGDSVLISTVDSSLEESVENLDLAEDFAVPLQSLKSITYANGTTYTMKPEDFTPGGLVSQNMQPQKTFNIAGINKSFDQTVASCGTGAIKLTGNLNASVKGFVNLKISWFSLKKAEAGVQLTKQANLTLDAKCAFSFQKEWHLLTMNYNTFVIWVGAVPIVVTPSVELYAGANGSVTAQVKYTVQQSFSGTYGVGWYKGEGWKSINQTTQSFTHSLNVTGSGLLRGWVGAKAGFKFYGVAFAYGYPKAFLEGNASYANNVFNYCLDGGLSIGVGARLRVLGKTLGEWYKELGETRTHIACGNTGGGTVTPPPPPPPTDDPYIDPYNPDPYCGRNYLCQIP